MWPAATLTSKVMMVVSVIGLMGELLLTNIWKAVAVMILRRTEKKRVDSHGLKFTVNLLTLNI